MRESGVWGTVSQTYPTFPNPEDGVNAKTSGVIKLKTILVDSWAKLFYKKVLAFIIRHKILRKILRILLRRPPYIALVLTNNIRKLVAMRASISDVYAFTSFFSSNTITCVQKSRLQNRVDKDKRIKDGFTPSFLECAMHSSSKGCRGGDWNAYLSIQWLAVTSQWTSERFIPPR